MNEKETEYKKFLDEILSQHNPSKTPDPVLPYKKTNVEEVQNNFIPKSEHKEIKIKENVISSYNYDKSKYEEMFISDLPLGFMYPLNTKIYFRSCEVKEIQDFSTYDRNNPFDFKNKLNDIIESCIILENPDGTLSSYLNIMDGDRVWLIYTIREKTFSKGKVLTTEVSYTENNEIKKTVIEVKRQNIEIWKNENIMEYYDDDKKVFVFPTSLRDEPYIIAPPTIGLRNCFDQYLQLKAKNKNINEKDSPFFKIAPYLKPKITYMSYEDMEEFQRWFEKDISSEEYSFLLDLINNHLKIGIRGLKKNMDVGTLRTNQIYPNDISAIFLISNSFKLFIKKQNTSSE